MAIPGGPACLCRGQYKAARASPIAPRPWPSCDLVSDSSYRRSARSAIACSLKLPSRTRTATSVYLLVSVSVARSQGPGCKRREMSGTTLCPRNAGAEASDKAAASPLQVRHGQLQLLGICHGVPVSLRLHALAADVSYFECRRKVHTRTRR